MQAADDGAVPSVLVWLDAGNDVDDFSEDQENTLLLAAASNVSSRDENAQLARALIARGADVNLRADGLSPFEMVMIGGMGGGGAEDIRIREYVLLLIDAGLTLREHDQHDPRVGNLRLLSGSRLCRSANSYGVIACRRTAGLYFELGQPCRVIAYPPGTAGARPHSGRGDSGLL